MDNEEQRQSSTIDEVRRRFEHWRRTRTKRTAIPERLWSDAVQLSESHSAYKISRSLGLNHGKLQKRIRESKSFHIRDPDPPAFIGFSIGQTETATECLIEMTQRNGSVFRAHMKGAVSNIVELGRAFLGCAK